MVLQASSWLCAQERLLAGLGGPYVVLGIDRRSVFCKASALSL